MKIAQVTHLYRPSIGGIENYVYRLNESLREADHSVKTFTTDLSLSNTDSPFDRDDDAVYCRTNYAPLRNPFSVELHKRLRETDGIDVYHLHSPYFLTSLEAAHALPSDAAKVMTVHGTIQKHNARTRILGALYKPFASYIFRKVNHSFVQGSNERDRLLGRYDLNPGDVSIIPNGINPEEFEVSDPAVEEFQEKHGLDPSVPTVLYVSRLIPEKNPDVFVEAVTEHLERDVQAVVVGTGEMEDELKHRSGDRVRFLSNLEFSEVKAAYQASDVFVFLGTWEGLPTVILEAMNAGLPIVSTRVGEIPNYLGYENGVLVGSPPDAEDVADAVRYYADNPEERRKVGETNREAVRSNHDWNKIAEDIQERYRRVARTTE